MYELRSPAPQLAPYVENYWFVDADPARPADLQVDVFVDARADLIFNFGAPYTRRVIGGRSRTIAASNLDAQRLHPIRIVQRGAIRTLGVRFKLGGLAPFATAPLAPLTGTIAPTHAVLGPAASAIEEALAAAATPDAQAAILDEVLARRLAAAPPLAEFQRALEVAVAARGETTLAELAAAAHTSPRQVQRLFATHLGIPPKVLGRVLRFQRAMRALMRDADTALATVAATAGYFDQAHFIREFRRMTGGVPRGYRGYYPPQAPTDFAPNVVAFVQAAPGPRRPSSSARSPTPAQQVRRWQSTGPEPAPRTTRGSSRRRR